jgi:hypothetical protein
MARNGLRQALNDDFRDFRYYREKGWFDSQYYYPVKLNPVKAMIGNLADKVKM